MRHGIAGNRLNRNSTLRKATIRDLAKATLIAQRICTTQAKAKEARKLVDHLITLGKKGSLADKRRAFAILCDHQLVSELFNKTSPRFKTRVGGYTRIISLGPRRGDGAQLVFLELTEKEEVIVSTPKTSVVSKKDKVSQAPQAKIEEESKESSKEASSKKDQHKDAIKTQDNKAVPKDTKTTGKNIVGGIRKMFNRKAGGK
jgi:large subunit ribosomal protein L17